MTRPTRGLVARLAAELDAALAGERVDRLWRTGPRQVLLKIRVRGVDGARVLVDLEQGHPSVSVVSAWPPTPDSPDRAALLLRKHLENSRVNAVVADARTMTWHFGAGAGAARVVLQLAGRYPNLALYDADGAEVLRLVDGIPASDPDSPPLPEGPEVLPGLEGPAFLVAHSEAVAEEAGRRRLGAEIQSLSRVLREQRERASRAVTALEREFHKAEAADRDRHRGELLKTMIGRVPRGATEVAVSDWSRPDGEVTVVELDPTLDLLANMERYFKRYRKFAGALAGIETRLLAAMEHADELGRLAVRVAALSAQRAEAPPSAEAVSALRAELERLTPHRPRQTPPSRRAPDAPALPYRRFESADGTEILVGRSARDNDRLTFQVARGQDVWLHARDVAGSHVILRSRGQGAAPSSDALLDAALLAAWHSQARGDTVVDVMWTERKHVRKARGGAPGLVTVAVSRNLPVRADADRLARLYRTHEA